MQRNEIDLGRSRIPHLFRIYFVPTLIGMLSICGVTAIDGIFIGHGVGSDGLAAVNICYAPIMVFTGIGLMLGVGTSVVSSVSLAENDIKTARLNITQSMIVGTTVVMLFLALVMFSPETTGRLLGSSETLLPLVTGYMVWIFPSIIFQMWTAIGLFVVRLDGSPKYAMWCNLVPALLNIALDYLFIFPLGMGVKGAALATFIGYSAGGLMVIFYIGYLAEKLRFAELKECFSKAGGMIGNLCHQCKIGISALLGEATMGIFTLIGNILFMRLSGNEGVGAFSIACYYAPFVFMVGNSIAQSAQPIISYNYRLGLNRRVITTERLAISTAVIFGLVLMVVFMFFPNVLVSLFLGGDNATVRIATTGLPIFAVAFVPFIFNLTAIGYFQSVERITPSIVFAILRGAIFIIPAFFIMANIAGVKGLWLSLTISETLTTILIAMYYRLNRFISKADSKAWK